MIPEIIVTKRSNSTVNDRQLIMLVDDDQDIQRLLDYTLKLEGFDTIIVSDGDSALRLLQNIKPDMVILDEMTPGNDNLQVIDRIREQSDVPIIVLAREYKVETLHQALSRGADDYIRKPISMKSFIARVRAKLRRTEKKRALV